MRVKELLKGKGITSKELALKLGMSETGLSLAIGGKGNPSLKRLQEIAAVLGVEVAELFTEKKDGFTAFIDNDGELRRFDSIESLQEYVWGLTLK